MRTLILLLCGLLGFGACAHAQVEAPVTEEQLRLDMTKVASSHYRVGRWQFDPVYGPSRPGDSAYGSTGSCPVMNWRVCMIVGWWSADADEDAGVSGADYAAVIYVRSFNDWPTSLGLPPAGAESATGWLRAYWPTGAEFYATIEGLADGSGGEALRNSEFWGRIHQHRLVDDKPVVSAKSVGRDPISEAASHPSDLPPYADRKRDDQCPPMWHPSGIQCEGVTPPNLTEPIMFQKLVYVFETLKSGSPSVTDPDPCMLSCPGEVLLAYRPAPLTFVGQRADEGGGGRVRCMYKQGPQYVFCCGHSSVRTRTIERQFAWVGECPTASSLPTSPFDLRKPPAGSPSFCPVPAPVTTTPEQPTPSAPGPDRK